jgi:hypothetical protein
MENKWYYSKQLILKNYVNFVEIVHYDLYNYYNCDCPIIRLNRNNTIEYQLKGRKIRITKLNNNIAQIGRLSIEIAFSPEKEKERVDIKNLETNTVVIVTDENKLNKIFLEGILIEVE